MKALKKILIILGILSCLYGINVVVLVSSVHWFNYAWFIVGGILILDGVFIDKLKELNRKLPKAITFVILLLIASVLIHFGCFEAKVIKFANSIPDDGASWIIVLGAKVNADTPSLEFQRRLEAAADYAKKNPKTKIILTGGMGYDEIMPESEAGYRVMIGEGIDPSRILTEDKSTSTTENLIYAKQLMENPLFAEKVEKGKVIIVSSAFHLYRASLIAQRQGIENTQYLGSKGLQSLMPHYYLREYAAYVRELL